MENLNYKLDVEISRLEDQIRDLEYELTQAELKAENIKSRIEDLEDEQQSLINFSGVE